MLASFRGRVTQIAGDLVQIWDAGSGQSVYLERQLIAGGDDLRLNDEVLVEGDETRRHARRLSGPMPTTHLVEAAAD